MSAAERPAPPATADLERWGLQPAWSRVIADRWHVLDTATPNPAATVLCVHGNPTWAYAWATFLRALGDRYRVIAIDQLGMGYSSRTQPRSYSERVTDLAEIITLLDIDRSMPFYVAAHDWGGAITMGWAVDHVGEFDGLILCNTGIAVPQGRSAPALIRLAGSRPFRQLVCRHTPIFVESATRLSGSRLTAIDREAFRAPYRKAATRAAIADFVGDVPLRSGHRSEAPLARVASRIGEITAPVLLVWGAADPVFNDDFASDLAERFSNVSTHRFAQANHLVMAEADVAGVAAAWLADRIALHSTADESTTDEPTDPGVSITTDLWGTIRHHDRADRPAIVDVASGSSVTFGKFADRVDAIAAELVRRGLQRGDRVAMLTPPGVELLAAVYGVWRAGGVTVVADRGLGLKGLGAAVRSSRARWIIGPRTARLASAAMRWAPRSTAIDIDELMSAPSAAASDLPAGPQSSDEVAVLFTSGATGPAKGVRYRYGQLLAQVDALRRTYSITDNDRFVAAFAPFALYGPALGISTALPSCDVTSPGKLTARALVEAVASVDATMVFASPAALANVVATSGTSNVPAPGLARLRLVLSAGAPVPVETLRAVGQLAPQASLHTPYGMTEALPVASIDLATIEQQSDAGVCVGFPVEGAAVRVDDLGLGVGEILVRAPWVSDGYDQLWAVENAARPTIDGHVWHRTGDVGHLDSAGRLWVEGRTVHVIHTAGGPVTPVPIERSVEQGLPCARSAAVGVGPSGCQQVVVVIEADSNGLAPSEVTGAVRALVPQSIAAVLTLKAIPVDIRHNAKVDRAAVARWAEEVLAGHRSKAPV
ncbi:MAG TPA: alpha/beta fold hydrolase [Ilumatobacter sp.]|nr:alpha/beta fold hydrolase [Ilumatobacter sp.]